MPNRRKVQGKFNCSPQHCRKAIEREDEYDGLCETEFKVRYYNHTQSFKHDSESKATELSKFIRTCKTQSTEPE